MEEIIMLDSADIKGSDEITAKCAKKLEDLAGKLQKSLHGEVYLTTEEVCKLLKMSSRTLQNHRDGGTIPFTTFGGKLLYPVSGIQEILDRNFVGEWNSQR